MIYTFTKEVFMNKYEVICDEGIDLLMDIFYANRAASFGFIHILPL